MITLGLARTAVSAASATCSGRRQTVASRALEKRTERVLHEHARSFVLIDVAAESQAERVIDDLLAAASDWDCIWVRCIQVGGAWYTVLWNLFLRLNERRDALRRRVGGGLVFAVHPSMKPRLRDAAPDLWSVRSLVLEPMSTTSALASRRADDGRVARAAGVSRAGVNDLDCGLDREPGRARRPAATARGAERRMITF
jgi:hypothetical protein